MTDSRALLTKESGGCMGVNLILQLHRLITTAQTLAPNYVTGAGWQRGINRGRREVVSIFMYVSDIHQISKQSLSCLKSHSMLYPKGVKRMKD